MNQFSTKTLWSKNDYHIYGIDASYFTMKLLCGFRWLKKKNQIFGNH